MRQTTSLDGPWQFQIDPEGVLSLGQITSWRTIQVPGPWQAQFDDLHLAAGIGWYRRSLRIPEAWQDRAVFLRFGAVDYFAEVWVNGECAGEHEGGYLPFELDVSSLVEFGAENEIVVRVIDPSKEANIFPQFRFEEIPHGKQSWYGPIGGIWQSVTVEARSPRFIRQIHVTPQGLSGVVSAAIELSGTGEADYLSLRCLSPQGEVAATADAPLNQGQDKVETVFTIANPQLWDLDSPVLYTLEVELFQAGVVIDRQRERFGIRTFEARDGKLWLNGKIFYLRGALDQDYYPEGIYTPPSLDYLKEQVRLAKAMGLNCLRCHIKVPDPRYLQAADEEGILVWAEVPSWGKLGDKTWHITEPAGRRARETFAGMVARDWNHPSVVIWSIVNEDWGTNLCNEEADRRWLSETFDWAKQVDPYRLIVDNSACFFNFHVKTDIDDYHFYAAMPDSMDNWQTFVSYFAGRCDWSFSPNGDCARTEQEPLIVSEFGNWGLPDLELLKQAYGGQEPWWFDTGGEWGKPSVVLPRGAEVRMAAAGLRGLFGDWSGLAKAAQWAQYRALKHEIEVMRAEPALSGYVITEWSDLHWECNGLVDMARNPRVFADWMPEFNADTVIVPRWERLAFWSGEHVEFQALVSHFGQTEINGAVLRWVVEGTGIGGILGPLQLTPGTLRTAGAIAFTAPGMARPEQLTVILRLESPEGQLLVQNRLAFSVFPLELQLSGVAVWSSDEAIAGALRAHGYRLDPDHGVRVVTSLDESTLHDVQAGGSALLVAGKSGVVPGISGVRVEARQGTAWAGDWASSFSWIRPDVAPIPGGPLLDFTWKGVLPRHVLTGVDAEDTLAGIFVGWVHQAAALAARVQVGAGVLVLTTFPVLSSEQTPVRTLLLDSLLRAAAPTAASAGR